jgi:hypothetical protein
LTGGTQGEDLGDRGAWDADGQGERAEGFEGTGCDGNQSKRSEYLEMGPDVAERVALLAEVRDLAQLLHAVAEVCRGGGERERDQQGGDTRDEAGLDGGLGARVGAGEVGNGGAILQRWSKADGCSGKHI